MMKKQQVVAVKNQLLGRFAGYVPALILILVMLLMPITKSVAADLQAVDYSSLPAGKAQIALTFSEPVDSPNNFSIDDPASVVLDFFGVHNKLDKIIQHINIGVASSITTVEAGDRTRVVINLVQNSPYTVEQQGNIVLVTIEDGTGKRIAKNDDISAEVVDIGFRRGSKGEALLTIELSDSGTVVDVRQQQDKIVVDLANTALPEKLHRRLDVIDFATPVHIINSEQQGSATQLVLSTAGKVEYLTYQSAHTLVVEVKVAAESTSVVGDGLGDTGEKLSFRFHDIEVRTVLQLLADVNEFNLVASDTVSGRVTLQLKDVHWGQALDIILQSKGLAYRIDGNVMLVAPTAELVAQEAQQVAAQQQLIELAPLHFEVITINFAKAADIESIITAVTTQATTTTPGTTATGDTTATTTATRSGFLSPRGTITVDERTNALLIEDTADSLAKIKKFIARLDKPVRQVLIESRIVIASNTFSKALGARFGVSKLKTTTNKFVDDVAISGNLGGTNTLLNGGTPAGVLNVNLPAAGATGSIALALAKLPSGIIEIELSAMQAEGQGEIISRPRVIALNRQQATIEQGVEIGYPAVQETTGGGSTTATTEFKDATLKLDVTPQITPDDHIIMELDIQKDTIGTFYNGIPSIDTQSIATQVLVDNGETVVLGGIYEQTKTNSSSRVPFFGDLPVVGFLFKRTSKIDDKSELLVFITPKIIKDELLF